MYCIQSLERTYDFVLTTKIILPKNTGFGKADELHYGLPVYISM